MFSCTKLCNAQHLKMWSLATNWQSPNAVCGQPVDMICTLSWQHEMQVKVPVH